VSFRIHNCNGVARPFLRLPLALHPCAGLCGRTCCAPGMRTHADCCPLLLLLPTDVRTKAQCRLTILKFRSVCTHVKFEEHGLCGATGHRTLKIFWPTQPPRESCSAVRVDYRAVHGVTVVSNGNENIHT
jgi:hypothetical protein